MLMVNHIFLLDLQLANKDQGVIHSDDSRDANGIRNS